MFEHGECHFQDLWAGKDTWPTYESNMPYVLRLMIDTKVRDEFIFGCGTSLMCMCRLSV